MNSRPKRTVKNVISAITADDSDIDEFNESSGDEFVPRKSYDQASCSDSSSSYSDDIPLAETMRIKQTRKMDISSDDEDDVPLTSLQDDIPLAKLRKISDTDIAEDMDLQAVLSKLPNGAQKWEKQQFQPPESQFTGATEEPPADGAIQSPYTYFRYLVTEEMLDLIENQTNVYSMQKDGVEINTTKKEIEIFIGIYLRMGLVKMPRVRSYWETATRFGAIADHMPRNRFEKLAMYLHFKDNLTTTNDDKEDKLWKVRPWLECLRSRFLTIPAEEYNSVDEIMVAFKGKSSLKQYIRGKPNPWGFKMWGRAGSSGILYDFDVYQGKKQVVPEQTIGVAGDVVLKLTETLPSGNNYKVFADNFFTSVALVKALKARSLQYVGTVRSNRLKGCNLKSEKDLRKEGRGKSDSMVDTESNTIAVRWYDNKSVDIISSFVGVEPQGEVRRWDKSTKSYIMIQRPAIIETYNAFMGGVDLLDSLTALYKQKMKSRRWYMYIFWHTIMITAVNGWLWYKRHCCLLKQKPMPLRVFISDVATCLIEYRARVGRPSLSPQQVPRSVPKSKPADDVRLDRTNHFPFWEASRQRCKYKNCNRLTFIKCVKCLQHFCLNKERNCFLASHI